MEELNVETLALDNHVEIQGKMLDGIETIGFLGEGTTASVYRARMEGHPDEIALKILRPSAAQDPHIVKRFMLEAEALSQLQHPNILNTLKYGLAGGIHYIAMDLVRGKELAQVLEERQRLPLRDAIQVTLLVARGLAYGHERGILHRDIKPGNIMVHYDGDELKSVRIVDFGLVKDQKADSSITVVGMVMGTPQYLSPEAARGLPVRAPADIYSLGIAFYEMLTGEPPFDAGSTFTIIEQQISEPLPLNDPNFGDAPKEALNILELMCEKDPEARLSSAEVVARLEALLATL